MSEEEQENLSRRERRAKAKGGGSDNADNVTDRNKKLRAEAAARRRKNREAERDAAQAEGLGAGERMDDAVVRSADATGKFLRSNFAWLQWIIILGVAAAIAFLVINYREKTQREKRGTILAQVLSDVLGRVAQAEPLSPSDPRLVDPRKEFATDEELKKSALAAWSGFKAKSPELKLAAKLGEAGALYDLGKYGEARAAYEAAAQDPQASLNEFFKVRALEGVGLTLEAEKKYPEAKKAYALLANLDREEVKDLASFHQARVDYLSGDKKSALSTLVSLDAKFAKTAEGPQGPTDYLGAAVRDLLKTVDPSKAAEEAQAISAAQMEELMKQFQQMQQNQGAPGGIPQLPPGLMEESPSSVPDEAMPEAPPIQTAPVPAAPAPVKAAPVAPAPVKAAPVAPAPAAPAPAAPAPVAPAPASAPAAP